MSNRAVSSEDRSGHGQNTKREDEQPGIGPGPVAQTGGTRGRCEVCHVTVSDIKTNADVEIVNPTQVIATIDNPKTTLEIDMVTEETVSCLFL